MARNWRKPSKRRLWCALSISFDAPTRCWGQDRLDDLDLVAGQTEQPCLPAVRTWPTVRRLASICTLGPFRRRGRRGRSAGRRSDDLYACDLTVHHGKSMTGTGRATYINARPIHWCGICWTEPTDIIGHSSVRHRSAALRSKNPELAAQS